jgi:hypothetical protein
VRNVLITGLATHETDLFDAINAQRAGLEREGISDSRLEEELKSDAFAAAKRFAEQRSNPANDSKPSAIPLKFRQEDSGARRILEPGIRVASLAEIFGGRGGITSQLK